MVETEVNDPANDEILPEKPEFVKVLFSELEQICKQLELAESFYKKEMEFEKSFIELGFGDRKKIQELEKRIVDFRANINYLYLILEDKQW